MESSFYDYCLKHGAVFARESREGRNNNLAIPFLTLKLIAFYIAGPISESS